MPDSSHGSACGNQIEAGAPICDRFFVNPAVGGGDQGVVSRLRAGLAVSQRPSAWSKAVGGPSSLNLAVCLPRRGGAGASRARSAATRQRHRAAIVETGAVPASVPVWNSRSSWLTTAAGVVTPEAVSAACARLWGHHRKPVVVEAATVLMVASRIARHADHRTGRNVAVSTARLATEAGCSTKTVQRCWQVLAALGVATEAFRGTRGPGGQKLCSVWHLIGPRRVDGVHLPSSPQESLVSYVGKRSPKRAQRRAQGKSSTKTTPTGPDRAPRPPGPRPGSRQRHVEPRTLHSQRTAAYLLAHCHGLDHGQHPGRIAAVLETSPLDLTKWSGPQLTTALEASMRERGWSWPDRIANPGGFLATRLRLLPKVPPVRVATPTPPRYVPAPARPVASTEAREAAMSAIRARPRPVSEPDEPSRPAASDRVHSSGYLLARQVIDDCQARAERPPVSTPRQSRSLASSAVHGGAQGPCWRCGTAGASRRPGMPAARAFMCDGCMTG